MSDTGSDKFQRPKDPRDSEITRLTALVAKYEAAIDEHRGDRRLSDWNNMCDVKLWQTRGKV